LSPKARKKNPPAPQPSTYIEPKRKLTTREKTIKTGAILIVVALVMSLLAGALSFAPTTPAGAAEIKSVQIMQETPKLIDTDGDGTPNNEDPDIDGDGIVNGLDEDIDGDGAANLSDGDPAETNGFDGPNPIKPGPETLPDLTQNTPTTWAFFGLLAMAAFATGFIVKRQINRAKRAQKNP
jgi:hypothetical protein